MGVFRLQTILVAALVVGCAPYEMQTVQGEPRADPSRRAQTQHEQKPGELTGEAKVSGNFVNVLVQKTTLCRDVTTTPMVADTTTEKKLTSNGRGAQYLLGGGAVLLAGAGVYWIGGPCSKKDTDAAGDSIERDCTSKEQKDQKNAGVGAIVLGGALAGMFVANVVRTQDEKAVSAHPPWNSVTPWKQCEAASARNVNVTLALHGKDITEQTDGDGIARFDLARVNGTPENVKDTRGRVLVGGKVLVQVDIASAPEVARWKRAEEEREQQAQAEREAAKQRAEAQLAAAATARKKAVAKWPTVGDRDLVQLVLDVARVTQRRVADDPVLAAEEGLKAMGALLSGRTSSTLVAAEQCRLVIGQSRSLQSAFAVLFFSGGGNAKKGASAALESCVNEIGRLVGGAENLAVESGGRVIRLHPEQDKVRKQIRAFVKKNEKKWAGEEFAICVDECLRSAVMATKDHCQAKCRAQ